MIEVRLAVGDLATALMANLSHEAIVDSIYVEGSDLALSWHLSDDARPLGDPRFRQGTLRIHNVVVESRDLRSADGEAL